MTHAYFQVKPVVHVKCSHLTSHALITFPPSHTQNSDFVDSLI